MLTAVRTALAAASLAAARSARPAASRLLPLRSSPAVPRSAAACAAVSSKALLFRSFGRLPAQHAAAAVAEAAPGEAENQAQRFDSVKDLHQNTLRALQSVFKYETMSPVQAAVLNRLPSERDVFVKAKTGTGKTLAFLIPAIETLLKRRAQRNDKSGSIIVISPTRELAMQIADEADKLSRFHGLAIHELVGGNAKGAQLAALGRYSKDIIVGTPGRLRDLIDSSSEFSDAVKQNEVLILDEADRLLDMGFRDDIQDLIRFFPKSRQTLLFSATVPKEVKAVANIALHDDHDFIDLVPPHEQNVHMHIPQKYVVHNSAKIPELIHRIARANHEKKVILFCPTTKSTMLYAQFLRASGIRQVFELHSGKAQESRTNMSNRFRRARNGILVTTDVSARGVDYPDVHLVVQIGIPTNRDQYIHRIGRTGRAGKGGSALLLLNQWEKAFLGEIRDLPIELCDEWSAEAMVRKHNDGSLNDPEGENMRKEGAKGLEQVMVHDCIYSLCGFYSAHQGFLNIGVQELPGHFEAFAGAFGVDAPDSHSMSRYLAPGKSARRSSNSFSRTSMSGRGGGFSSRGGSYSSRGSSSFQGGRVSQFGGR